METCHRHQFFILVAQFDREHFLGHLANNAKPHPGLSFLSLHLQGPFDFDNSKNLFKLGRMSLTLTLQMSLEERERLEKKRQAELEAEKGDGKEAATR